MEDYIVQIAAVSAIIALVLVCSVIKIALKRILNKQGKLIVEK